jgi:hypothetical protein
MNAVGESVLDWERSRALDLDDVPRTFERFAAEAYDRTQQVVGALPPRPLMRLELVRDVPYTVYCDYLANTMRVNADQTFAPERLKLLVLHEAYPGHNYYLWRREDEVHQGQQPADSLLVITNTPSSPLFEGIGDNGAAFPDWLGRTDCFDCLYGRMHSPRSLALAAELSVEHT